MKTSAKSLPWIRLQDWANEALLLHGTLYENAIKIARVGFDENLCKRGLYGAGVYMTTNLCKAVQKEYTGAGRSKCVIIGRTILGHPYLAKGPRDPHARPPDIEGGLGIPHDSVIAKPGTPNGKSGKGKGKGKQQGEQVHWEMVIRRGDLQIYPELIVKLQV